MFELIATIKAWYIVNFCYTLTVPEYKGFHVAKNLREYWSWRECYPMNVKIIVTIPKF